MSLEPEWLHLNEVVGLSTKIEDLQAEIERLRAALQQIVTEADSDDGLTAWDGSDIARRALEPKP